MWKRLLGAAILAHASFGVCAASGTADAYPSKPIRMIDGFAAGGTSDFLGRVIGPKLTERFGQTVIVENRPGAGGTLGAEIMTRANPDGHTLYLAASTTFASASIFYPKLGFDLLKDFSYISSVATSPVVLVAHPSLPAKSVTELVALARSKPKAIRYASAGVGGTAHLTMELLMLRTGMDLLHVPYKGGSLGVIGVAAGETHLIF